MIPRDLNLMRTNFLINWNSLSPVDQQKGVSSALIAEWISRDIEMTDILMPILEFKRFTFSGCIYWVHVRSYAMFRENIEALLLR